MTSRFAPTVWTAVMLVCANVWLADGHRFLGVAYAVLFAVFLALDVRAALRHEQTEGDRLEQDLHRFADQPWTGMGETAPRVGRHAREDA